MHSKTYVEQILSTVGSYVFSLFVCPRGGGASSPVHGPGTGPLGGGGGVTANPVHGPVTCPVQGTRGSPQTG